jgi:cell shape-determining protein MreD
VKCALALILLGALVTMAQGAAAAFLPPGWCPDLGLLLVVATALAWRSAAGGVVVAGTLGYVADLLSGTLLGQQALLRVVAYGMARFGSGQLNLRGVLPQMVFVALLTPGHAVALAVTTAFFAPDVQFVLPAAGPLLAHALANGLCAPLVIAGVGRLVGLLVPEEGGRRLLRLEPRSFA